MNSVETNEVLNILTVLHSRSLATYLMYAKPWYNGNDDAQETLELIAEQHRNTADRLATLILENGGDVASGEYPMQFTSLHDLGIDYLLKLIIRHQSELVGQIEHCVEQLSTAPMAKEIAEEILGEAKGHLEALEDLATAGA